MRIASDLLRDGSQRVVNGKISPLDLEKLSSELALRLSRENDARKMLETSRNQFALLLSGVDTLIPSNFRLNFSDTGWDSTTLFAPSPDSIEQLHPDYLSQKFELERALKTVNAHKNLRLPQVDLLGSCGYSSTAKTGALALKNFQDRPQTLLSGGIEVEIPMLGNLKERQLVHSEEQNVRSAKNRLGQYSIQLRKQCALLKNQTKILAEQLNQERIAVRYHTMELKAEHTKLKAGKSNFHPIYEIEERLREAQRRLLEVVRSYHETRTEMLRDAGVFLLTERLERLENGESKLLDELLDTP